MSRAEPPPPSDPGPALRERLQVGGLLLVLAALTLALMGLVLLPARGMADLALQSGSTGVQQSGPAGHRLNVVVPAGEHRFAVQVAQGVPGGHVLHANRTMFELLQMRQPAVGTVRDEYFFDPMASSSEETASYFEFPVQVDGDGSALVEFHTRARRDHMLTLQLLTPAVAARMERRASMGAAARYGAMLVLAFVLLTLHMSTREPVSLAYAWFVLTCVLTLLVVNGHFYMLSGVHGLGRVGEAGIGAARMLFIAAGLRLAMMIGHAGTPPPRLARHMRWIVGGYVALAAVILLDAWPPALLQWDALVWGGGALGALWLTTRTLRAGIPFAPAIVASLVSVVVLALWNDLADAGRVSGIWWTLRGFQAALLILCTIVGVSLVRRVRDYQLQLEVARAREDAARRESHVLRHSAQTDVLTGLSNRRALDAALAAAMTQAVAQDQSLAVLFIDLDHFKHINDRYGHAGGDAVLREVAVALRRVLRAGDALGRWGGEEFVAILPGASLDAALASGERLRQAIEQMRVELDGNRVSLATSVGVAVRRPGERDLAALVQRADQAVYQAKHQGRNRVAWIP